MEESNLEETVELVRAAKSGNEDALDALLRRYGPVVTRIAELRLRRQFQGDPDVEDLVQETLLDAFRGLERFEMSSEGDFRHWLATIVENNVRDHLRRGLADKRGGGCVRRQADLTSSSLSASLFPGNEPGPSTNARANELEQRIQRVIMHELEDSHREVIILRKLCGMTYDEIAAKMGYEGASSARALCTRALQKLRSSI